MYSHSTGNWFCGPAGLFGFHFGGVFHIILWAACLILLFTLLRALFADKQNSKAATDTCSPALTILEERYASGEIDQAEFFQKKNDLK